MADQSPVKKRRGNSAEKESSIVTIDTSSHLTDGLVGLCRSYRSISIKYFLHSPYFLTFPFKGIKVVLSSDIKVNCELHSFTFDFK